MTHLTPHIARVLIDERVRTGAERRRHAPRRPEMRTVRPRRTPIGS
jgi:hypothetical protein